MIAGKEVVQRPSPTLKQIINLIMLDKNWHILIALGNEMISGERFSVPIFFPVGVEMQGFYETVMWVRGLPIQPYPFVPLAPLAMPHYRGVFIIICLRLWWLFLAWDGGIEAGWREIRSGILNVPTPMSSPDATLCLTIWTYYAGFDICWCNFEEFFCRSQPVGVDPFDFYYCC